MAFSPKTLDNKIYRVFRIIIEILIEVDFFGVVEGELGPGMPFGGHLKRDWIVLVAVRCARLF